MGYTFHTSRSLCAVYIAMARDLLHLHCNCNTGSKLEGLRAMHADGLISSEEHAQLRMSAMQARLTLTLQRGGYLTSARELPRHMYTNVPSCAGASSAAQLGTIILYTDSEGYTHARSRVFRASVSDAVRVHRTQAYQQAEQTEVELNQVQVAKGHATVNVLNAIAVATQHGKCLAMDHFENSSYTSSFRNGILLPHARPSASLRDSVAYPKLVKGIVVMLREESSYVYGCR